MGRGVIFIFRWSGLGQSSHAAGYHHTIMSSDKYWSYGMDAIVSYRAVVDDFGNLHLLERMY